jgi:hypothetical protein
MSSTQLVARGLAIIEPLRAFGYTVSLCPGCGAPVVSPPASIEALLEQVFEQPEAVQAALAAFPNGAFATEDGKPGDHDQPYAYGEGGGQGTSDLLTADEQQRLACFKALWLERSGDDQTGEVA